MGFAFDDLVRLRDDALNNGKIPTGWQLSLEAFCGLLKDRSPDPRDRYVDGQPLTLLGLNYSLGPTQSGARVVLNFRV